MTGTDVACDHPTVGPEHPCENRWVRAAARIGMAAFVVMPSFLTVPRLPDTMVALALSEGDAAFRAFDNEAARVSYQRAFAIDSTDCRVLWRLARAHIDRGMVTPEDDRKRWFVSGEQLARRGVAACPDSTEAHFFLAVAIGQLAKLEGGKRKIELSKDLKMEAERTLALDPRHAGAMHILGRWHYELSSVGWFTKATAKVVYGGVPPGASYEQAKEWFEHAIAIRPDLPLNHLWLGETLIKLDDYASARGHLQACLALDDVLWDDAYTKAQAEKALDKIEGK